MKLSFRLGETIKTMERRPTEEGYVFTPHKLDDRSGRPAHQQVGRIIRRVGKSAGIEVNKSGMHASAHYLRKTGLQRLANAGIPPRDLPFVARHSEIKTTQTFYISNDAHSIADRLGNISGNMQV